MHEHVLVFLLYKGLVLLYSFEPALLLTNIVLSSLLLLLASKKSINSNYIFFEVVLKMNIIGYLCLRFSF